MNYIIGLKSKAARAAAAGLLVFSLAGCAQTETLAPYEEIEITIDELEQKMDDKETFTLLVERENCDFCEAMNTYIEQTQEEHPGIQVYKLDTTDYELYREQEGDMTLISETEQGQRFLARFPYFLYTPAIYKIEDGVPVSAGLGYDESRNMVSLWDVDSTIDWNTSRPLDVWTFLAEGTNSSEQESASQTN